MNEWQIENVNDFISQEAVRAEDRFNVLRRRLDRGELAGPEYDEMIAKMELYSRLINSSKLSSRERIIDELNEFLTETPEWAEKPLEEARALRYWHHHVQALKKHFLK